MQYMNRVRLYTETKELAAAVERAVRECIEENILKEFLTKYRSEAIAVCIFEFDEEKFKKAEHEAGEAERLPGLADEVFLLQMYEKYQL